MAQGDLGEELFFENSGSGCFGCSKENPDGLQLRFFRRGETVVSPFTIPDRFHGAPSIAHGGIVATLLDEISCAATYHLRGDYVVTGELAVRYEKPCPVDVALEVVAEVRERRPRYWIVDARVERDGEVLAKSEGRFFPMERPAP